MAEKKAQKKTQSKKASGLEAIVYDINGKETGSVKLPETIFAAPWNGDLVHQVVVGMQANARAPLAHAKDRSAVRGGGRKPWRQKGTGRARHGSRRSPIWVGGGVTHGPSKERVWKRKINKKMRVKALYAVLSQKYRDGEVLFVDDVTFAEPKTKMAKEAIDALAGVAGFEKLAEKKKNTALIALGSDDAMVKRSFGNMGNVLVDEVRNLNPIALLSTTYVIITKPEESIATLSERSRSTV